MIFFIKVACYYKYEAGNRGILSMSLVYWACLLLSFVNVCMLASFPFGFDGGMLGFDCISS